MKRTLSLATVAAALWLVAAAPAGAASGGLANGFDAGAEGWTGSETNCTGLQYVCDEFGGLDGHPPGALFTRARLTLGVLSLFHASGTWTSPDFEAPSGAIRTATLLYERRFDPGGLVSLGPASQLKVTLLDRTGGGSTLLLADDMGGSDTTWTGRGTGVPVGALTGGHTYALRFETTMTSSVASLGLREASTGFDNVQLAIETEGGGEGDLAGELLAEDLPLVSDGVLIEGEPLSPEQLVEVLGRLDLGADVGGGPGGSLVPLARCTIRGTPRADRIRGTRGNDVICGLGGRDRIQGLGGRDVVDGGNGADRLDGGAGGDALLGLRGRDRLTGRAGGDRLGGGAGGDRLAGGRGRDRVIGGSGRDTARGRGKDVLRSVERVL